MFASIFIPHFQTQSLVRNEPELANKAVAVIDGDPPLQRVVEANAAARQVGVELGMTRIRLQHFFDIVIRQRSTAQEASAHAALLDCAAGFSPRVEDTARDTVTLDIDGLERLFGSYFEIATQIFEGVLPIGLRPNVAVAANVDAAIHAARGFNGQVVLARGTERKQLARLPLNVLTEDAAFVDTMRTLHRWGLHTFGDFGALPAEQISARLGARGVRLHAQARGASARTLTPHKESLKFEEAMELDDAVTMLEPLRFILSRLLDQVCHRLRARHRATHEVRVRLDAHERVLRLPMAVCDPKMLVELLMLDLESHPPGSAVTRVNVEAIPAKPRTIQNGLFVPLAPEPEKLELTLARIAHEVGKKNVGSPELMDTHRRDAFRMNAYGTVKADSNIPKASLAFRQFRPAREATVQLRHDVPSWIAFRECHGPVVTASGPWKASGEWWREDRWSREEWDIRVKTQHGFMLLRIYREASDHDAGRWFAEGTYD